MRLNPKNSAVEKIVIIIDEITTVKKLPKKGRSIFSAITPINDDGKVIKREKIKKEKTFGLTGIFLYIKIKFSTEVKP